SGLQGTNAIAVREPSVHWSGTKAVFSMVIGAPTKRYEVATYYWQIYEITGLGQNDTPVITKVANQPALYNNVSPLYGTDERLIFTSDRPRNGQRHLYPQLDEYEEAPTNTGLWSLAPATGDLFLIEHSPSGAFSPILDSFGRLIFTRWDHLQRDQQADADAQGSGDYGTFNYSNESATATRLNDRTEVFPEPRSSRTDLLEGTNLAGHTINLFLPWQVNEDGTDAETLNHIGRHELDSYFNLSLNDDPNLREFIAGSSPSFNQNPARSFLQIKEDPRVPGRYIGTDAPEFETHASGQIVSLNGAPTLNADQMAVTYLTHRDTLSVTDTPGPNHSGHYRDPLPLSDGSLIAVHTSETRADENTGSRTSPGSRYDFRLKTLVQSGSYWVAGTPLTAGINETISFWDPDELVSYSGPLWELNPVEVRARPRPTRRHVTLPAPEQQILAQAGVELADLQAYLTANNLALVVSRNVTSRDDADKQQPYNLRIAGGGAQTVGATGKIYDVAFMQFFQADQLRGVTFGNDEPRPGRRVLAQAMHDPAVNNPPNAAGPTGSVVLGADGSMAAFVPARRALSWQLTDSSGTGVVRERFWLTFQPGEVRVCASCHGLNQTDQAGQLAPNNPPEALLDLLEYWKENEPPVTQIHLYLPAVRRTP
nr:hypothetical protein [Ardenticatenales bacterium]